MCWSAETSAVFGALEVGALAAIVARGRPRDRWYAVALSPIVGQELAQVGLWLHIGASANDCDSVNAALTFLVRTFVTLVPLTFTLLAVKGSSGPERPALRGGSAVIAIAAGVVALRLGLMIGSVAFGPRLCTTAGPSHHQIWPDFFLYYNLPWLALLVGVVHTALPVAATLVYLRPRWVGIAVAAIACGTLAASRILLPVEWESVWCWLGVSLVGFAVLEPYIGALALRRRTEAPA